MTPATWPAPSDWQTFKLGDLLSFSNGINADKSAYGSGVPFANVLEIINHDSLQETDIPGRVNLPRKVLARYEVQRGDILFNRTSETQDEVGLASVYLGHEPIVFGGFVFRGRPLTNYMDVDYSKYALRAAEVRNQITACGQGGIRANVSQRDMKDVAVTLPPMPEQQIIAQVLDIVSSHIKLLKCLIAKKQAMKLGMMQQLLTGQTRLSGFDQPWRGIRLGAYASMVSGGTPPSGVHRFYDGGIPWVSISDMTRGGRFVETTEKTLTKEGLVHSAARLYPEGVVLYAMYASLGECAIAVGRVSSSQAILGIHPGKDLDRDYLYYRLAEMKEKVREIGQQGTQANLNAGMVRDFRFDLPDLAEQRAIAQVLAIADDEIDAFKERLGKAQAVKQGMMQQLLTGRIRLAAQQTAA